MGDGFASDFSIIGNEQEREIQKLCKIDSFSIRSYLVNSIYDEKKLIVFATARTSKLIANKFRRSSVH